ncbi:cytochrome C oxidase copper chaperone-domain-containing protein [Durotheca rogersii]|uniref:cytochrome C oxidase copper chaperone-domain-containing protein n=1 Tax=Durotheca rogersii TaxID=419775 RepID=UPI00221FB801|nr:cytochrome C oxidase copper chaperone-domain-containing protein [Durotheca rogersii]XP_051367446.1 cytochrome C oxidase copper chaperone-domain-containing protein [Durotheca rogersii]KAI5854519.1 cytochrome C oxidase copper chaperone-domain-containing protein [Durotheca rogersii]KAI5856663.1 cytochrome C oxidase copper chaperone-domain-containing protein [Durotheca rogersii]
MASQKLSMPSISSSSDASRDSDAAVASKPKPCCVCKDEKSKRDECMLFSKASDPASDCKTTVQQYKSCMAGFGFQV